MRRWFGLAVMALCASMLAGCGGNSSGGTAQLRLLNASVGYPSLDLSVNAVVQNSAVAYGTVGNYVGVSSDAITTSVSIAGSSAALSSASRTLSKDVHYTQVAYGWQGAIKIAQIQEDAAAAATGQTKLTVLNLAPDAGSVDVYLSGATDTIDVATLVATNVAGGGGSAFNQVGSGTYRLRVTGYGAPADLRLDVQGVTLASTQLATLILTPGLQPGQTTISGGVLVSALLMVQQSTVSAFPNTQARARAVSALSGSNSTLSASVSGTPLSTQPLPSPGIGSYTLVPANSAAVVTASINGSTSPVTFPTTVALVAGGDYTLVVSGDPTAPLFSPIIDDNRLPLVSTTNAKIRLLNATYGATNPAFTLLADLSIIPPSVFQGRATPYSSVLANSAMQLEVDSSTQGAVYNSGANGINVLANHLYTVFLFGDGDATTPPTVTVKPLRER